MGPKQDVGHISTLAIRRIPWGRRYDGLGKKELVVRKTCGLLSGLDDFDFSQPLLFWSLPRYVMMPVNVADRGWDDERCGACLQ